MKLTGIESRSGPPGRILIGVAALALAMLGSAAPAQPTTGPSSQEMRRWVGQLDDADPEIRESAAQSLMALSGDDLPALREAALSQRPLTGAQLTALREAVMQVFLESQAYPSDITRGFLGLHWPLSDIEHPDKYDTGVIVADRIPGFGAYRLLRSGDVIVKLVDFPNSDLHTRGGLTFPIASMHPGDVLRLHVLRGGRVIKVSVVLAALPLALLNNPDRYQSWLDGRMHEAEQYWNDSFGPLLREVAQSASTQP
jgi:hypothetical protein